MAPPRRGSPARDLVGRTLGDFVVMARLDEGGHGVVYRAEQPALGRSAVIKVMQARQKGSEQAVQRFLREARLASKLDHPYAAHIYAFGAEPDGLLWIAMELVRGTPLDRMLAESGALPLERLVPFFERLCEVVHTAHEQGIVHRDLKPANVMVVARAGRLLPKLLDLGIAKMTDAASTAVDLSATGEHEISGETSLPLDASLTSDGMVVGSPLYMAPEQWTSPSAVDARTDVYALAVLAYEALTRRRPFAGPNIDAVMRAHAHADLPPLGDGFPSALHAALARGLAKLQADRPATALDLAAAVRAASGLEAEREALPRLDDETRAAVLADAPPPIADAVAALDGARHGYQQRDVLHEIVGALCHWLGVLALACRSRLAQRPESELLVALTRRRLGDAEWLELARQLCRPYADSRDLFPLPELVGFVLEGASELESLAAAGRTGSLSEEQLRPLLVEQLAALGRILRALGFLADYPLAGSWMGARRPGTREPTEPLALVDPLGKPLLRLAPLVQIHAPSPGAPLELFLFAGRGRRGARFVAPPRGFERTDEDFWPWFREHLFTAPDAELSTAAESSPYRGLSAFSRDDAGTFFGREAESETFLNRLRTTPLCAVVGPSGAGKSSFLQAGVIPGLDASWKVVSFRPGATPSATLASHLPLLPGPALVVVDQAEELFTLCLDPAERLAFAHELVSLARDPVRVVLTLRDDFLIRMTELAPLRDRLGAGLQLLATPARADLLRILTLPAERAGYRFEEEDLPARMVDAVAGQPGALALLSFTASRLWELRDRHFKQLPRKAYDALGGVGGALAQHAERVRAQLPADEQRLLREAFRALVTAEGTRAVLSRAELLEVLGDTPAAARAVDKLIDARLLQTTDTESGPTVEVIHETLLAAWPRLVEWRREDAEGARLRDQLRAAARQWDERGRAKGLLWRDDALAEHQRWRARYPGQLTAVETAFGDASLADAGRNRRNRRLLIGAIFAGLSLALAVALVLRTQAVSATDRAELAQRKTEADFTKLLQDQGRRLLLEDDVLHAYPYLVAAYDRAGPNPALLYMLGRATRMLDQQVAVLPHKDGFVWDAMFTPDGEYVLSSGNDRLVKVWDRKGRLVRDFAGHQEPVATMAVSPDSHTVVSTSDGGETLQWDLETGQVVAELPARPGGLALAYSPDGTRVAAGARGGLVLLWDPATRRPVAWLLGHVGQVRSVRFFDSGRRLFSAGVDGRVLEWDAATGRFLGTLVKEPSPIRSVVISPGDRFATVASFAGRVTQIELATRAARPVRAQSKVAWWALSTPSGELVTMVDDPIVQLWDLSGEPRVSTLVGHEGGVYFATLSPDTGRLATAGKDGLVLVWNRVSKRPTARLVGHTAWVRRVAFDPRGELLVSASLDFTARLWRPTPIDLVREERTALQGNPSAMALSPDGSRVAVATATQEIALYEPGSFRLLARGALRGVPRNVSFSGDSTHLAAATARGIEVLDARDLTSRQWVRRDHAYSARFLTDGSLLFGVEGAVERWDVDHPPVPWASVSGRVAIMSEMTDVGMAVGTGLGEVTLFTARGERARTFLGRAEILSVLLDPKGQRLFAAGIDNALYSWDLSGQERPTLEGHAGAIETATLVEDGTFLATGSSDGTVRIWEVATGAPLAIWKGSPAGVVGVARIPGSRDIISLSAAGYLSRWELVIPTDFAERRKSLECRVPFVVDGDALRRIPRNDCELSSQP